MAYKSEFDRLREKKKREDEMRLAKFLGSFLLSYLGAISLANSVNTYPNLFAAISLVLILTGTASAWYFGSKDND